MQIKLFQSEVMEAITKHIKEKYGVDINVNSIMELTIESQVREYAYEKHRNGKLKKDEHGCSIIDYKNSKWITKHLSFDEESELYFYIENES